MSSPRDVLLCLALCAQLGLVAVAMEDSVGEALLPCVEVVEVLPYPQSVLNATSDGKSLRFTITFSRPVHIVDTALLNYPFKLKKSAGMRGIFLSSDPYNYTRMEPYYLRYTGGGRRRVTVMFRYHLVLKKFFRSVA